ncbi:hypothetical protein BMS3Bbin05_00270 [bacterium BMS3Bbin05]|nr:hypothetical protein BMS3Bbin05_00270 [bacterium BMS3Bbin05]HDZ61705.1 hypothetical protein [Nitrospirota bacterium]
MSKALLLEDFRAVRIILEPDDFAFSSGDKPRPSDLADKETWHGITILPDDVAIRTSNHHGDLLKTLYDLWGAWIEAVGEGQASLYDTILDAADEFQAATFNALHGYYRQAIGCLRNALEQITIGTYCQVCGKATDFVQWRAGQSKITFGQACDSLAGATLAQALNAHLQDKLNDSIFNQKTQTNQGGWARRLYSELSDYAHTRPGFTNVDMWASNGPIYVQDAFVSFGKMYLQTSALGFLLVKLGRPSFQLPQDALSLFRSAMVQQMKIARVTYKYLFSNRNSKR